MGAVSVGAGWVRERGILRVRGGDGRGMWKRAGCGYCLGGWSVGCGIYGRRG